MEQGQHDFQRATRAVAAASMGSMLVLTAFAAGGSHAAAPGALTSSPALATDAVPPTSVASEAVAALPVATSRATVARTCTNAYVVRPGDFWLRLAKEASVPVGALYALNGAGATTLLQPGQRVCLPDGAHVVVQLPVTAPLTTVAPKKVHTVATVPPVTAAKTTRTSH